MAGEGSHVSMARNPFARKVMVPYSLDGLVNTVKVSKKAIQGVATIDQTIALAKKQFETKNVFYEDNAKGSADQKAHKLVSAENMQMSEQSRQQAIMGVDPDEPFGDPNYIAKLPPAEKERIETIKSQVEQETKYTVDLAYYYLTNDAFAAVVVELEIAHFSKMNRLVLRGNSIDDDGLLDLCDCLVSAHNTALTELDLSETKIGDRGIKGLIEVM